VLKLVSPGMAHKARHGGVRLHLWTEEAVRTAFHDLDVLGRTAAAGGFAVLVERQLSGIEIFVGRVRHPRLGVLVGIGPGGGDVEHEGAVRWQWGPVGPAEVAAVLPVGDAHAQAIAALVAAMESLDPQTIETNPVFLTDDGRAVVADALVETAEEMGARS